MSHRVSSRADGTVLVYDRASAGPAASPDATPVLLLHGSVLSRALWRGLGYVEALRAEREVLRMDLRGHGTSGKPVDPAAYATGVQVEDVLSVLDDAGFSRAHLLGYSLGARVALATAVEHPARVERLVLLGGSAAAQQGVLEQLFFPGVIETLAREGMEAFADRQGLTADRTDPLAQSTRFAFLRADPQAMAALFTATDAADEIPPEVLAQVAAPALWMAGTEDHPRYQQSQQAAQAMPQARFVPLVGRDHGITLAPAGPVLEQVLPFLR